ncbi:hypothetical protein PTKIN_Ptkin09bG0251600 [Pterospermum kingtungense]
MTFFDLQKTILKNDTLREYIYKTSAFPKEHEQLKELREATVDKYQMRTAPVYACKDDECKENNGNWSFHCYSFLTTALALPEDGKILAIDIDKEAYEFGLPYIKKAGVEHKINFIQSNALTALNDFVSSISLLSISEEGSFDYIFVDARKNEYLKFHELTLKLVKIGGIIAYENTLWYGLVAQEEDEVEDEFMRSMTN